MSTPQPRVVPRTRLREALRWFAWSLPALPLVVQVHELGHLVWFKIFGFADVRLHYAAVSFGQHDRFWEHLQQGDVAGAARIASLFQVGVATATGILITYATIAISAYLTTKRPPHPFIVALGLTAALRFKIAFEVLQRLLFTKNQLRSGSDEGMVSAVSGVQVLFWIVGLTVVAVGWTYIIRGLPRGQRWKHLGLVAAGVAVGAVIYIAWLGPMLLPY